MNSIDSFGIFEINDVIKHVSPKGIPRVTLTNWPLTLITYGEQIKLSGNDGKTQSKSSRGVQKEGVSMEVMTLSWRFFAFVSF
jgi:hypothetical protein